MTVVPTWPGGLGVAGAEHPRLRCASAEAVWGVWPVSSGSEAHSPHLTRCQQWGLQCDSLDPLVDAGEAGSAHSGGEDGAVCGVGPFGGVCGRTVQCTPVLMVTVRPCQRPW